MWSKFEPKPLPTLRYTAAMVAVLLIYLGLINHNNSRLLPYLDFGKWMMFILAGILLMGVFGDWLGSRRAKPEQYDLGASSQLKR
jgi:hypothetical protein